MTVVTLSELLGARDESLRVQPRAGHAIAARLKTALGALSRGVGSRVTVLLISLLRLAHLHGLVLSGCTAFVIAAATLSATLAWFTAGAALFFLEARRR
jgi:hypothetical protein